MPDDDNETFDDFEAYCREVTAAAIAWEARWPNHCKTCYGQGGKSFIEMHGFHHGAGEQMFDTCSCVEVGQCPRCSQWAWIWADDNMESEVPCWNCGWNWCKGSDDACPEV